MALGDDSTSPLVASLAADPSASTGFGTLSDIQRRQLMAQQLMTAGSSTAPVQSPWQGAARLVQGIMGGYDAGQLALDQKRGQAADPGGAAMLAALMNNGSTSTTPAGTALGKAVADYGSDTPSGSLSPSVTNMLPTFAKIADGTNVTPDYLARVSQIESRGNWNAQNPSGAAGGFQFMPSTARAYGLSDPTDPVASTQAAVSLTADNRASLKAALGRPPTDAELYLAHQQGAGGAAKLLNNPNAPAASIVGQAAVTQNGGSPGMTAGQFAGMWLNKYARTPGVAGATASPAPGTPGPVQVASLDPSAGVSAYAAQPSATAGGAAIDAAAPLPPPRPADLGGAPQANNIGPVGGTQAAAGALTAASDTATGGAVQGTGGPNATQQGVPVANAQPASSDYDPLEPDTDDNSALTTGRSVSATPPPQPAAAAPAPRSLVSSRVSPQALNMAMSALSNPYASPASQQIAKMILTAAFQKDAPIAVAKGTVLLDPNTRQPIFSNKEDDKSDQTNDIKNYNFYVTQARAAGQQPMPFDTWATAKARAAATSITTNVDTNSAQTYDQQLAQGLGKAHAALSNGVEDAQARARDLAAMQNAVDAIQKNGGTTGGMGASQVLDLQKTINAGANALGFDKPFNEADLSDKEFLTKINRQIAGAMAKGAVGGRVTNFEMGNYLKANPGLEMTLTGNQRLIGIQSQIEQRNVDVGNAIRSATANAISQGQKINPSQVQSIITNYDAAHHIRDPLTGQDLTQNVHLPEFQNGGTGGGASAPTVAPAATPAAPSTGQRTRNGINWSVSP